MPISLLSLPSNLLSLIVRLIAAGNNKEALAAIASFASTNRLMRSAKNDSAKIDIYASILAFAPVRAVPNELILRYMKNETFAIRMVSFVLGEPSTALMPRIAGIARDPNGARLADALHARLVASLRTSTVNGDPMYAALGRLESLATEIVSTLKGAGFKKIGGSEIDLGKTVKAFIGLSVEARTEHARVYGPMCIWDVSGTKVFTETCKQFMFDLEDGEVKLGTFNSDLYWDTSAATTMKGMFLLNDEFKGDLSTWDVSHVENMRQMFTSSGIENSGIGSWDVRALQNASRMFEHAIYILPSLYLSGWNIGNCSNMTKMFAGSSVTDNGIARWNLRADAKTDEMFAHTNFTNPLRSWSKEHRDPSKNPGAPVAAQFGGSPKSLEENVRDLFASALREQPDGSACAVQ
jgi:hypothetical protein